MQISGKSIENLLVNMVLTFNKNNFEKVLYHFSLLENKLDIFWFKSIEVIIITYKI